MQVSGSGQGVSASHGGRRQKPLWQVKGTSQALSSPEQGCRAQTSLLGWQRIPTGQSSLSKQARWHAPKRQQVVPVGQVVTAEQPLQMPPGAVLAQVRVPGQSLLPTH